MRATSSTRALLPPPPAPSPAPSSSPSPAVASLGQLRLPRRTNEYVESPRARPAIPSKAKLISSSFSSPNNTTGGVGGGNQIITSPRSHRAPPPLPGSGFTNGGGGLQLHHHGNNGQHHNNHQNNQHQLAALRALHQGGVNTGGGVLPTSPHLERVVAPAAPGSPLVVTQQPESKSPPLKKDASGTPIIPLDGGVGRDSAWNRLTRTPTTTTTTTTTSTNGNGGGSDNDGLGTTPVRHGGIICSECHKCRCQACTEQRELPHRLWCRGRECSCVDVISCFCAVKCLFFHCRRGEEEEEDNECYANPCGCCSTPRCCARWTVLGLASVTCLPCLALYWPARACLAGLTMAYNSCCLRTKGCRCDTGNRANRQSGTIPSNVASLVTQSNLGHHHGTNSSSSSVGCSNARGKGGTSVLTGGGGGGGGGEGGRGLNTGSSVVKNSSKHSQARRLLIESDSSSA